MILAAAVAAGCGGRASLRYEPREAARTAAPAGLTVALKTSAERTRYQSLGPVKDLAKAYAEPPEAAFRKALELELTRLGLKVVSDPAGADGTVLADLLEVTYLRGVGNMLSFGLGVQDKDGRLLGQRLVRGVNPPPCRPKHMPLAVADAMRSVGPVLEGEGWLAALAGQAPPDRAPVPFPAPAGSVPPKALVLPLEDRVGVTPCNSQASLVFFEGDKAYGHFFGRERLEEALRQELRARAVEVVRERREADWVVRPVLVGYRVNCIGSPFSNWAKLRARVLVEDPSGALLWEGDLDGHAPGRGLFNFAKDVPEAAARAGAQFREALAGRAPAALFSEEELVQVQFGRGGLGGLGFLASFASVIPGASGVGALAQKAGGLRRDIQAGLDLAQAAKGAADAAARAEQLKISVPKSFAGRKVAVLPFNNLTNDLQGPVLVRQLLQMQLGAAGFRTEGLEFLDGRLHGLGVTDGGQLRSQEPAALGRALESDVLLYGELVEFQDRNLGVYASRTVEAKVKAVDAASGAVLWEGSRKKFNPKVAVTGQAVRNAAVAGYASALAEKAMGSPLRPESEDVVRLLVRDMAAALEDGPTGLK